MTTSEFAASLQETICQVQADIEAYDEPAAIQAEENWRQELRGLTTAQLAVHWLQQPDTTWGRHAVVRAWLRTHEPHVRVFTRVAK